MTKEYLCRFHKIKLTKEEAKDCPEYKSKDRCKEDISGLCIILNKVKELKELKIPEY